VRRWNGGGRAVHDPGKIFADLVVTLALGGDCLADIAVLRAQPGLAGPVASDPVVSRLISIPLLDQSSARQAAAATPTDQICAHQMKADRVLIQHPDRRVGRAIIWPGVVPKTRFCRSEGTVRSPARLGIVLDRTLHSPCRLARQTSRKRSPTVS